jgi:hypothetical protein
MEGVKYIRDGHLYPAIDTAKKQYAQWFSSPGVVKRKLVCDCLYHALEKGRRLEAIPHA